MFDFARKWFAAARSPIGIDLGTDTIRLAQCTHDGEQWRLTAAACTDVPAGVRNTPPAIAAFTVAAIREMLDQHPFRGRQAVLSVPSSRIEMRHVRLPKSNPAETLSALPPALSGILSIDPKQAILRHAVAGETDTAGAVMNEIVVMAIPRQAIEELLALAGKAGLEVVGLNTEPKAVIDCFAHVYRRKTDADVTNCFIDLGARTTRVTVARNNQILFARTIEIGGDAFSAAAADGMGMSFEQAKLMRIKLARQSLERPALQPVAATDNAAASPFAGENDRRRSDEPVMIVPANLPADQAEQHRRVTATTSAVVARLCDAIDGCRRDHEQTFPHRRIDRILFVGGEARQRGICQQIAQSLAIAAQLGDPLVRMSRLATFGVESGLDLTQPQPAWSVAVGLSMGPKADVAVRAA